MQLQSLQLFSSLSSEWSYVYCSTVTELFLFTTDAGQDFAHTEPGFLQSHFPPPLCRAGFSGAVAANNLKETEIWNSRNTLRLCFTFCLGSESVLEYSHLSPGYHRAGVECLGILYWVWGEMCDVQRQAWNVLRTSGNFSLLCQNGHGCSWDNTKTFFFFFFSVILTSQQKWLKPNLLCRFGKVQK